MYSFLIILCLLINIQINTNATAINRATARNNEEQSAEEEFSTEHRAFTNSHGYQFLNEEPLAETARHKIFDTAKIKYHGKYIAKENPRGRREKRDAYTNIPPAPTLPPLNFEDFPYFVKTLLSSGKSATISNPSPTPPAENIWQHSNPAESIINNTMSFFPPPSQNLKNEYRPKTYGLSLRGNEGFAWNNVAESQQPQIVYYGTIKQNKERTPNENSINPKELRKIVQHKLETKTTAQDTKADRHKEQDILKWIEKEEQPPLLAKFDKPTQEMTPAKDFEEKLNNISTERTYEVKPKVESSTINNEMTHKPGIHNQIGIEPKSEVLNILHKIFIDGKDIKNDVSEINEDTKSDVKSDSLYNDKLHTIDSKTNRNKYLSSFKLPEKHLSKGTGANELSSQVNANVQTNKNNEIEETLEDKLEKSFKNIIHKIPAYRQDKNDWNMNQLGKEMGFLKHTYGMHIKGNSGFVWNKLTPNDHEYYVGEQNYGETKGLKDENQSFKEEINSAAQDLINHKIDNDKDFIASTKIPPEVFNDINKKITETNIKSSVYINNALNKISNPTVNTTKIINPIVFENSAEQKESPKSYSEEEKSPLPNSLKASQESFITETSLKTSDNGAGHSTGVTVASEEVVEKSTDAKNIINLDFLLEPPTKESSQESSIAETTFKTSDNDIEGHSTEVITATEDLIEESPEANNTLNLEFLLEPPIKESSQESCTAETTFKSSDNDIEGHSTEAITAAEDLIEESPEANNTFNLEFLLEPLLTKHYISTNKDINNPASQNPSIDNQTENKDSNINEIFNKMHFIETDINNDNGTPDQSVNEQKQTEPVHTEKPNTYLNEISPIIIFKEESDDDDDDKKLINIRSYETLDEVKKENNWKDTIASLKLPELDLTNGIESAVLSPQVNKQPIELETRTNTVKNKDKNDYEETHQGTTEKSDNNISKIPEFIQSRNMASEVGSLEHTYGMNIKGNNAYVWNKVGPNNHEYYVGEQKTNDEIEDHKDKTINSDSNKGNKCANFDYLLQTAEFWEWFSKWSSSYTEIINETIRHLVSEEIVKQFTERNININNIEERKSDKDKIKPESNQTGTSMNVKAHSIYGNSLGSDHVTNIFVFNDMNSSNKVHEDVIADDNITSNESKETDSDTPVEALNSTPSTIGSITDADSDDNDGPSSIITEDHINDIISTTYVNNTEKESEPVPKYELYTNLDDSDETLPLNDDMNSIKKLINVRSCDVPAKDNEGYNSQTITNLVNEEIVKQLADIKSNKNEKPDKVATKPNANKISTTMKVDAHTVYGNSLGSDHVTNIFVFYPNTKTLKDIMSVTDFEKATIKDGDRNTHKTDAVTGINSGADLPTTITGTTSQGTRLPNRTNNVPDRATSELLESTTENKSEANKTYKEINTLKHNTYTTLLDNDTETTIQAGNKYFKDTKDISNKEPNTIPVENVTELNNYSIAPTVRPSTVDEKQIDWIKLLQNIAKDPTELIPIDKRMENDIDTVSQPEETALVDTVTSAPNENVTEMNDDSKTSTWSNDVAEITEVQKKNKTVINDVINSIVMKKSIGIDNNKDDNNIILSNGNKKKTISEQITTPLLPNMTGMNNDSTSYGAITTSGIEITTEIEDSTTTSIDAIVKTTPEENVAKIGNVRPSTVDEKQIDWIKLLQNIAKDPTELIPLDKRMENYIETVSQPEETELVDTVTSAPNENVTEMNDDSKTPTWSNDVAEITEVQKKNKTVINDVINSIVMEKTIGIDNNKDDDNIIISNGNKKKTISEQITTPLLPNMTGMNNDSTSYGAITTSGIEITTEIEDSTTTSIDAIVKAAPEENVAKIGNVRPSTVDEKQIDWIKLLQNIARDPTELIPLDKRMENDIETVSHPEETELVDTVISAPNENVTEMNDDSKTPTWSNDVAEITEVQKKNKTVINDVINSIVMEKRIGIDGDEYDDNKIIAIEIKKKTVSGEITTPLPNMTGMNNDSISYGAITTSDVEIMTEIEDSTTTSIDAIVTSAPEETATEIGNDSTTISVTSTSESDITTEIKDNYETVIDTMVSSEPEENIKEIESTTFSVKPTIGTLTTTESEDNKETTVNALIMLSSNENVTEMNDDVAERTEVQKNNETVINDIINSILMEKRIGIDSDENDDNRIIAIEIKKKTVSEEITTPLPNMTGMNNDSISYGAITTSDVEIMTEIEDSTTTSIDAIVTSAPEETATEIGKDSTTISVTSTSESDITTEIKDNYETVIDTVVSSEPEENIKEIESTTFSVKPTIGTLTTTESEDNKETTVNALSMLSSNENVTEMNDDVAERTEVQKNNETVINDIINSILMEKRIGIDSDENDDNRIIAIEIKKKTVSEEITTPLPNMTGMNNDSISYGAITTSDVEIMTEIEDSTTTSIDAIVTSAPEETATEIGNDSTTISVTSTSESEITTEIKDNYETVIDTVVSSEPEENIKEIESTTFSVKPTIGSLTTTESEDNKETTVNALIMLSSNENVTEMNDDVAERTEVQKNNETVINDIINSILMEKRIGIDGDEDDDNRIIAIEIKKKTVSEEITTSLPNMTGMNNDSTSYGAITTSGIEITTESEDSKVTLIDAVVTLAPEENVTEIRNESIKSTSESEITTHIEDNNETVINAVVTSEPKENIKEIVKAIIETVKTTDIEDNKETIVDTVVTPAPNENVTEMNIDSTTTTSSNDVEERTKVQIKHETQHTTLGVTPTSDIETTEIEDNIKSVVNAVVTSPKEENETEIDNANGTSPTIETVTTIEIPDKKETIVGTIVISATDENVTEINDDSATTASSINGRKRAEAQKNHETALSNVIKSIIIEKRIGIDNDEDEDKIINAIENKEKELRDLTRNSESTTLRAITISDADPLIEIEDNQETIVNAIITPAPEEN